MKRTQPKTKASALGKGLSRKERQRLQNERVHARFLDQMGLREHIPGPQSAPSTAMPGVTERKVEEKVEECA